MIVLCLIPAVILNFIEKKADKEDYKNFNKQMNFKIDMIKIKGINYFIVYN